MLHPDGPVIRADQRADPTVSKERRDLAEQIDQFCGRLNVGLIAMAIVLAALVLLAGVYRVAEILVIPQSFATVGTT